METKKGHFYGAIQGFDEQAKTVDSIILHYDSPNENYWTAKAGSLDSFLERLNASNKGVSACYQHDDRVLIGKWMNFKHDNGAFSATLYLSDTPFVRDTVIPQLKDKTLQGSSPTICAISGMFDNETGVYQIIEGALAEISLVGLPADLEANILKMTAKIEAEKQANADFEISLITL